MIQIQFNLDKYEYSLDANDFRGYAPFADFRCARCDFSAGGKIIVGELFFDKSISIRITMSERPYLNAFFYGDAPMAARSAKDFIDFLRVSDGFDEGYLLIDPAVDQRIERENEEQWLLGLH